MAQISAFELNTGALMPAVGMGCWQGEPGPGVDNALLEGLEQAFKVGYRHFDTAALYENEKEVGAAVRRSGVPRNEVFVTTKLASNNHDNVEKAFNKSMEELSLDYVDLYLMHWPQSLDASGKAYKSFNQVWAEMEKLLSGSMVKAIGVSNFSPKTLRELLKTAKVVPAVNQIESHPYLPETELFDLCKEHGIHLTAYSPLGQYNSPILTDADLSTIASSHNCTIGQVALSWQVQRGVSVCPKSTNPRRMRENLSLVTLTGEEMARVDGISRKDGKRHTRLNVGPVTDGKVFGWTLDEMGWTVGYNSLGVHP